MHVVIKTTGPAWGSPSVSSGSLPSLFRRQVQSIDPTLAVFHVRSMEATVAQAWLRTRQTSWLLVLFALLALALALVGIYGVISYAVRQRTHEIAIRLALGARAAEVTALIAARGLWLTAWGLGLGVALALGLTRFMAALLFQVQPTDPLTIAAAAGLIAVTALGASLAPALRAVRIAPAVALRCE